MLAAAARAAAAEGAEGAATVFVALGGAVIDDEDGAALFEGTGLVTGVMEERRELRGGGRP